MVESYWCLITAGQNVIYFKGFVTIFYLRVKLNMSQILTNIEFWDLRWSVAAPIIGCSIVPAASCVVCWLICLSVWNLDGIFRKLWFDTLVYLIKFDRDTTKLFLSLDWIWHRHWSTTYYTSEELWNKYSGQGLPAKKQRKDDSQPI
jgi:hypothetical protein